MDKISLVWPESVHNRLYDLTEWMNIDLKHYLETYDDIDRYIELIVKL
jgi:hypothetical protein